MVAKSKNNVAANKGLMWIVLAVVVVILVGTVWWMWQQKYTMAGACTTENLQLTAGQQSGAAGTIYQHMALTNTGKYTCTMSGYPTAFLYGTDGYALGSSAASRPQPMPVSLVLASGETAHTVLGYPQAGNFNPGVCSSQKSTSVKIYPPSSTQALEVPLEVAWCPGFSQTALQAGS